MRSLSIPRRFLVALLLAVSLLIAGASRGVPAPPSTAVAAEQQSGSKADLVRQAFRVIAGQYFNPVDTTALLNAAWDAAAAAAAGAGNTSPPARPYVAGDATSAYARFDAAYRLLEANTGVNPTMLAYATIRGMTLYINNCHTGFLTPSQAAARQAVINGTTAVGPGYVRQEDRPWVIDYVVPGGPAGQAGLRPGDTILAYDGDSSDDAPLTHVKELGEPLVYTIQRPGESAPRTITVMMGYYRFPQLESRIIDGTIGYLRFFSWENDQTQAQAIRTAIAGFEAQGVQSWILDVRANGGGIPSVIADLFIPSGTYLQMVTRNGLDVAYTADGNAISPLRPMVILVGPGSASASEIVPEAIREAGDAVLVGDHTPGCMAFSTDVYLSDGSDLVITIGHALIGSSGQDLEGIGVQPDIEAPQTADDLAAGRDPGLDAAVRYLQGAQSGTGSGGQ